MSFQAKIKHPHDRATAIVATFRDAIIAGRLRPGEHLPPRRELAGQFATTLSSTQKALARLAAAGFVVADGRHGTRVVDHPPHLYHYALLIHDEPGQSRYQRALREEAARLTARGPEWFSVYFDLDHHAASPGQRQLMADLAARRLAGCILDMHPIMLGDNPLLDDRTVPKVALVGDSHRPDLPSITTDSRGWLQAGLDWLAGRHRRRIAWMGIPNIGAVHIDMLVEEANRRRLATSPAWSLTVDYRFPQWTAHAVAAIFQAPPGTRPDGLLIADDNIAEAIVAALDRLGLRIPHDLDIVTLNNFPLPLNVPAAVCQLGFGIDERIDRCLHTLREMAAGRPVPKSFEVSPCFACDLRNETNPTATERIMP